MVNNRNDIHVYLNVSVIINVNCLFHQFIVFDGYVLSPNDNSFK